MERATRFVMLLHLPDDHTADTVQEAIVAKMAALPAILRKTLTWDQAKEIANHAAIAKAMAETGATSIKQMGAVVKSAKAALEGKTVDGKALSDRVRARLS